MTLTATLLTFRKRLMKLTIPKEVEAKLHAYVMSVNSEIAGMGKLKLGENGDFIVEDVMIYEQEVSGATADLSSKAVARWMSDLVKAGGSPKEWKLWWHSHDTMSAFFSKTDTDTIDRQNEGDWMVSLVVNRKREREARLDLYRPFRVSVEDIEIEIAGEEAFTVPADIALEVSQKVKRKEYTYTYTPPTGGAGFGRYSGYKIAKPYVHKKGWRKMYDLSDEDDKDEVGAGYTVAETAATVQRLESSLREIEATFGKESNEYTEIMSELADWYYALADLESDAETAELIRNEARSIENDLYMTDISSAEAESKGFHV